MADRIDVEEARRMSLLDDRRLHARRELYVLLGAQRMPIERVLEKIDAAARVFANFGAHFIGRHVHELSAHVLLPLQIGAVGKSCGGCVATTYRAIAEWVAVRTPSARARRNLRGVPRHARCGGWR